MIKKLKQYLLKKRLIIKKLIKRAHAERNVLKVLDGDCETAVGVHSKIEEEKLLLRQNYFL